MYSFKICILVFLFWPLSAFTLDSKICSSLFSTQIETDIGLKSSSYIKKQIEDKIGFEIRLLVENSYNTFIRITDRNSNELAWADFYVSDENTVKVVNIRVIPKYQRLGLSKLILSKIVEISPQLTGFRTSYIDDNRKIFSDFIEAGYSVSDAIKNTPTYKSMEEIGYTEFQEIRYIEKDKHLIDYTVVKPHTL